jgi:hypothetical protein
MLFEEDGTGLISDLAKKIILHNKEHIYQKLLNSLEKKLLQEGFILWMGLVDQKARANYDDLQEVAKSFYESYLSMLYGQNIDYWNRHNKLKAHYFFIQFIQSMEDNGVYIIKQSDETVYFDDVADVEAELISSINKPKEEEGGAFHAELKP